MRINRKHTWSEMMKKSEFDPNGLAPSQAGAKLDKGKVKMELMLSGFTRALTEVGKVTTYGSTKYSPNGWTEVEGGIERYGDAALRHLASSFSEDVDEESGLLHDAQVCWNYLAKLELKLRQKESDNDNS